MSFQERLWLMFSSQNSESWDSSVPYGNVKQTFSMSKHTTFPYVDENLLNNWYLHIEKKYLKLIRYLLLDVHFIEN